MAEPRTNHGVTCYLRTRYDRRVRPFQVYPVTVELEKAPALGTIRQDPAGEIPIRLEVPGALVWPAEQTLIAGGTEKSVTFQVTPLAYGDLPQAQVSFAPLGQRSQTIPLTIRGVGQRWVWIFLLLFLLLPSVLFAVRGATRWTTPADGSAPGGWAQRLELFLPAAMPLREMTINTTQATIDFVVLRGGEYRLSFIAAGLMLFLALTAYIRSRPKGMTQSSAAFSLPALSVAPSDAVKKAG